MPADWLEVARALDLYALLDLAARDAANPVVTGARDLLRATAGSRTLAADRPDPLA